MHNIVLLTVSLDNSKKLDTLPAMTALVPTADDAIAAALAQDWKRAITINASIVKSNATDVDALSRLAFAYLKNHQLTLAKRTYQKVLTLDKYNQIATKNLKKLSLIKKTDSSDVSGNAMSPMIFLEEPGKTKIVECVHVAPDTTLSSLSAGQEVSLKIRQHGLDVRLGDAYIAALPDDIAFKLTKMINGGNTYQVIIKSIDKKSVKVLIRELSRGKRYARQPSFSSTTSYVSFSKGQPRESIDMTPTGEENE